MSYILLAAYTAVMRSTQGAFHAIQLDAHTRAMARLQHRAQVMQQGLDLPPVNIAAHRFLQNGMQYALVFMAHTKLLRLRPAHADGFTPF